VYIICNCILELYCSIWSIKRHCSYYSQGLLLECSSKQRN